MPILTIQNGSRSGEAVPFDRTVVVGRGSTADVILDDTTVSRRHAVLTWANDECMVEDLQTQNGTFVNGKRLKAPVMLKDGDELRLGRVLVKYTGVASATMPIPARPSTQEARVALVEGEGSAPIMVALDAESSGSAQLRRTDPQRLLASVTKRLELMNDLSGDLGQTFDDATLFDTVMRRLFDVLPQAERGIVLVKEEGTGELVPRIARSRSGQAADDIKASRTLLNEVVTRRQGILSIDTKGDAWFKESESLIDLKIRNVIVVPMLAYDEVYGVIQVDSSKIVQPFDEGDVSLVLAVARQLALAMAVARMHSRMLEQELFHRDLSLARKIQQRFLPSRPPDVTGFDFSYDYTPALAVGGDYYDFLELPEGAIGIAVGDVSGKGVSAALYVAKLGTELRYNAVGQTEPSEILRRLNATLARDNEEGMFVTLALVTLEPRFGRLKVANAGHLVPLVREARGRVEPLESPSNSPLGVREDDTFEQRTYELDRGDVVVLYTDGVTEAQDRAKALYGEERLVQAIARAPGTAPGVRDAVLKSVKEYFDGEAQNDDITVVTVAVK